MTITPKNVPDFRIVIPARLHSSRLPNKLLANLKGKPVIQRVYENAVRSSAAEVVVATDSAEIAECIDKIQGQVCITSSHHLSGSDRIAEAVELLHWSKEVIVVNVQGDEPFLSPEDMSLVAKILENSDADMATLAVPLDNGNDISTVKVVRDKNNIALYFSRAAIPYGGGKDGYLRHIGIYAYRCAYLKYFTRLTQSPLECSESLEQLRALFDGAKICVGDADSRVILGIDTLDDLHTARRLLDAAS